MVDAHDRRHDTTLLSGAVVVELDIMVYRLGSPIVVLLVMKSRETDSQKYSNINITYLFIYAARAEQGRARVRKAPSRPMHVALSNRSKKIVIVLYCICRPY